MVCNRGHTQSGAIKISRLNNPVDLPHIRHTGPVCSLASRLPTVASHETGWGSRPYLPKDILTLYGILPCVRTAVAHPSLANFMCVGMVRRQSYDICVKKGLRYRAVNSHGEKPCSVKEALVLNSVGVMNFEVTDYDFCCCLLPLHLCLILGCFIPRLIPSFFGWLLRVVWLVHFLCFLCLTYCLQYLLFVLTSHPILGNFCCLFPPMNPPWVC